MGDKSFIICDFGVQAMEKQFSVHDVRCAYLYVCVYCVHFSLTYFFVCRFFSLFKNKHLIEKNRTMTLVGLVWANIESQYSTYGNHSPKNQRGSNRRMAKTGVRVEWVGFWKFAVASRYYTHTMVHSSISIKNILSRALDDNNNAKAKINHSYWELNIHFEWDCRAHTNTYTIIVSLFLHHG